MALEDEIINIQDLDIAKEIKIGDFVLLETTDGTKLIDFKDFIIGTDNITFFDKISGGDYLQTTDISGLSADVSNHKTILTDLSGVDARVDSVEAAINNLASDLSKFVSQINSTSEVTLATYTTSKAGFRVSVKNPVDIYTPKRLHLSTLEFKGSELTEDTHIVKGTPTTNFSYTAIGSYTLLLIGSFTLTGTRRAAGGGNYLSTVGLKIYKNDQLIFQQTADASRNSGGSGTISFVESVNLVEGDKITIIRDSGTKSIVRANVSGTIS
jgi:hypothetical protein